MASASKPNVNLYELMQFLISFIRTNPSNKLTLASIRDEIAQKSQIKEKSAHFSVTCGDLFKLFRTRKLLPSVSHFICWYFSATRDSSRSFNYKIIPDEYKVNYIKYLKFIGINEKVWSEFSIKRLEMSANNNNNNSTLSLISNRHKPTLPPLQSRSKSQLYDLHYAMKQQNSSFTLCDDTRYSPPNPQCQSMQHESNPQYLPSSANVIHDLVQDNKRTKLLALLNDEENQIKDVRNKIEQDKKLKQQARRLINMWEAKFKTKMKTKWSQQIKRWTIQKVCLIFLFQYLHYYICISICN